VISGGRQRLGAIAAGAGIVAIAAAVVLHHLSFTIDGTSASISRWHALCTSAAYQPGRAASGSARSRCGEISLTEHATAGLVLLAAILGVIAARFLRAGASGGPAAP
jgi:hypothetical protein